MDVELPVPEADGLLPRPCIKLDDGHGPLHGTNDRDYSADALPARLDDGRATPRLQRFRERELEGLEPYAQVPVESDLARVPFRPDDVLRSVTGSLGCLRPPRTAVLATFRPSIATSVATVTAPVPVPSVAAPMLALWPPLRPRARPPPIAGSVITPPSSVVASVLLPLRTGAVVLPLVAVAPPAPPPPWVPTLHPTRD